MKVYYIEERPAFINLEEVRYAKVYKSTYKEEVHYELVIEFKNVKDSLGIGYQTEADAVKRLKSIYDAMAKL